MDVEAALRHLEAFKNITETRTTLLERDRTWILLEIKAAVRLLTRP